MPSDHFFAITVLPESVRGPDGERLGEIRVDEFREKFCLFPVPDVVTGEQQQVDWNAQLQSLLAGSQSVALRTDPRMAWICYREADAVFVQQHLLMKGWGGKISRDGVIIKIPARETVSEDGGRISEWRTTIDAIREFVDRY